MVKSVKSTTKIPKPKAVKPSKISKAKSATAAKKKKSTAIPGTKFIQSTGHIKKKIVKNPNNSSSKRFRGISVADMKKLAKLRGQLSPIPAVDREQCDRALGDIKCDASQFCYICLSRLIPHIDIYSNCPPANNNWKLATLSTKAKYYPQCEHIIACTSLSKEINAWHMNYMMLAIHKRMLDIMTINPHPHIPTFASSYTRPIASSSNIDKLMYFLEIIIRMNYEWSHATCNNTKTNIEFADYDKGVKDYILKKQNIEDVLYNLFEEQPKYFDNIEHLLGGELITGHINKNKFSAELPPGRLQLRDKAYKSVEERVKFILDNLRYSKAHISTTGYSTYDHTTFTSPVQAIRQGGADLTFVTEIFKRISAFIDDEQKATLFTYFDKIYKKISVIPLNILLKVLKIMPPNSDYDKMLEFMKNIYKNIFLVILEEKFKKYKVHVTINEKNAYEMYTYILILLTNLKIDDYFFKDVIFELINLSDEKKKYKFLYSFFEYLVIYKKNIKKYKKRDSLYEYIKKIENTKSYELLIKFLIHILDKKDIDKIIYEKKDEYIKGLNYDEKK